MTTTPPADLSVAGLLEHYRAGTRTPTDVVTELLERGAAADAHHVWITRLTRAEVMPYVDALATRPRTDLPLYGIPFVIKDNLDLAGVPTSAGCPAYAYVPRRSATVVQKLIDAGAIPLGKTNLDQFATGLVGSRSPYGAGRNSFNPEYISGGSSAGSAVAVALGLASFALGTDTAGSGRVPAAFNNLVGLKPAIGRLSARGMVPACRSLDCVSIFTLTARDAAVVFEAAQGFDAEDAYSRTLGHAQYSAPRIGIPRSSELEFFGDADYARLFALAVERVRSLGATVVDIELAPFLEAARLLYDGPWIAERYAAVGEFLETHPGALHPVTQKIVQSGKAFTAAQVFQGQYALKALRRRSEQAWAQADFLMTPTAGTVYTLREVADEPVATNSRLGYYTNYMNLFDLTGVAVPAGFRRDGLPFGVTLVGNNTAERALLAFAERLQRASVNTLGATGSPFSDSAQPARDAVPHAMPNAVPDAAPDALPNAALPAGHLAVAVCGAHMQGLPLNHQLRDRNARLLQVTRTAACYRLLALPGGPPQRPGLIRATEGGAPIELEVWALPLEHAGSFLSGIPAPLGLGKVELESGGSVTGFICEGYAEAGATDITRHGGWRAYLDASRVTG